MLRLSGSARRHPYGKFPDVSVNDNGVVVEVHQPFITSTSVYYQVGRLTRDEVDMSEPRELDRGRFPKVAISNGNRVVEVHEGRYLRRVFYRIGTVPPLQPGNVDERPGHIDWLDRPQFLCWGRFPAVAVHNNRVLITCDSAYGSYSTWYYFGIVGDDGNITWHRRGEQLFSVDAVETSVALNAECAVAVGRGWISIVYIIGQIQGQGQQPQQPPMIQWMNGIEFDHLGYCPTVCLDEDNYVIMVWQSFTLRQLKYITGRVQDQLRLQLRPECKNYDYGYNPSIALSPTNGQVVEEHETNLASFRCTLHYHTGILAKNAAAIEQPAGQNQRPQHGPGAGANEDIGENGIPLDDLHLENNQHN